MRKFALLFMLLPTLAFAQVQDIERPPPEAATGRTVREAVEAKDFMIVAANPLAADAGRDALADGGSAVDAAIAAQLVLNLVEPQSSGIGGGAFMMLFDRDEESLKAFDGRETAPAAAKPDLFLDPQGAPLPFIQAVVGGRSVGTPGLVRLMEHTHRRYGRLAWARLFQPAIELAEEGFIVSPRLAALVADDAENLRRHPGTRAYFFTPDGAPIQAGSKLKNPEFAATLRAIADRGAEAFYTGDIARDIVDTVRNAEGNPGHLTREDLEGYKIATREPVCAPYREVDVCGMGPPSSGAIAVGQILGLLGHFDMKALKPGSADAIHLFAEASKLAYADRGLYVGDADFVNVPTRGLLDRAYLTTRAQLIHREKAGPKASPGNPPRRDATLRAPDRSLEIPSTSHISVVDRDRNVVSMTTTIEAGFGSRLMVRGFLLNNQLTDFSFTPEERGRPVANRIEGGKRPRSSMAPTIVFNRSGDPILAIGSPGGSRIIPYVAKTIVGVVDWNLDIQEAIDLPHFGNQNGATELEADTSITSLKPALEGLGHEVKVMELNSGLHGIALKGGRLYGGADPRREGKAAGR